MTSWEPHVELEQLRYWANKMDWGFDELSYEGDFRFRAWRRVGEKLTVIWRNRAWAPGETWFETPDVEGRMEQLVLSDVCTALRWWEPEYDFRGMADTEISKMLQAQTITWRNSFNAATLTETDTLPPIYDKIRVCRGKRMRRPWITYANGAFRSVFLDAITNIEDNAR